MSTNEKKRDLVTSHTTERGWPMVGIDTAAIVDHLFQEHQWILEPWQARVVAARLETLASQLVRVAGDVEHRRCGLLDPTEVGAFEQVVVWAKSGPEEATQEIAAVVVGGAQ